MARDDPHFRLRLPADLKAKIEAAALAERRTINAEVVARLEMTTSMADLINSYREAEERLMEQAKIERELRRQIELLQEQITLLKAGAPSIDLNSPVVQDAMVKRMHEVMGAVVEDMREEQRIANGMPLLLKWWERNPEERALYDQLSEDEQDEYVREHAHSLWIDHLNEKRQARPNRAPRRAVKGPSSTTPKGQTAKRKK